MSAAALDRVRDAVTLIRMVVGAAAANERQSVMSLEEKVANFLERTVYGRGAFPTDAATLRTLIKFFEDHQSPLSPESPLRKCLAALEAGEKSSAVETYRLINRGGMWGIGDWIPPITCSCETGESASITFMSLLGTWLRQMSALAGDRPYVMRQEQLEPRPSLPPHCCEVCGRDFGNEYFHTGGGGDLVPFADFDDSAVKADPPAAPGVVGVAWICAEHVPAARARSALSADAAVRDMQRTFGVRPPRPRERKPNPELFVVDVGPNRSKVFAIVRQATGCSPDEARKLVDGVPFKVAEGWPRQFDPWRRGLEEAGAVVEVRWD